MDEKITLKNYQRIIENFLREYNIEYKEKIYGVNDTVYYIGDKIDIEHNLFYNNICISIRLEDPHWGEITIKCLNKKLFKEELLHIIQKYTNLLDPPK